MVTTATLRPDVRSDELADGDVEGAGDSRERIELGAGGVAENAADDGGGEFEASGEGALGDVMLFHELLDTVGDAFLGGVAGEFNSTRVPPASWASEWRMALAKRFFNSA
jgi:hypothetical protein